jgi:hypothetical protein
LLDGAEQWEPESSFKDDDGGVTELFKRFCEQHPTPKAPKKRKKRNKTSQTQNKRQKH